MSKPFTWRAEALCSARTPNPTGQSGGKDNRIVFGSSLESTNNGRVMSQRNIRLCSKFRQQTTWQVRYDWYFSIYQSDVHVLRRSFALSSPLGVERDNARPFWGAVFGARRAGVHRVPSQPTFRGARSQAQLS